MADNRGHKGSAVKKKEKSKSKERDDEREGAMRAGLLWGLNIMAMVVYILSQMSDGLGRLLM